MDPAPSAQVIVRDISDFYWLQNESNYQETFFPLKRIEHGIQKRIREAYFFFRGDRFQFKSTSPEGTSSFLDKLPDEFQKGIAF